MKKNDKRSRTLALKKKHKKRLRREVIVAEKRKHPQRAANKKTQVFRKLLEENRRHSEVKAKGNRFVGAVKRLFSRKTG